MKHDEIWTAERQRLCMFLLAEAARKNITHDMIAEHVGMHRSSVTRALQGKYPLSVDMLIAIGSAIDIYLFLESKDAVGDNAEFMRNRQKRPDDTN
jgi:cyanate lyase